MKGVMLTDGFAVPQLTQTTQTHTLLNNDHLFTRRVGLKNKRGRVRGGQGEESLNHTWAKNVRTILVCTWRGKCKVHVCVGPAAGAEARVQCVVAQTSTTFSLNKSDTEKTSCNLVLHSLAASSSSPRRRSTRSGRIARSLRVTQTWRKLHTTAHK